MDKILFVTLGGALGATFRYLLSTYLVNYFSNNHFISFITPIFIINGLGCFIAGIIFSLISEENLKVFLLVGILGGFTTFSSFRLEFLQIAKEKNLILAFVYVVLTNIFAIISVYIGYQCMQFTNT